MKLSNYDLIQQTIQLFREAGVKIAVVCAGARNAALVLELKKTEFKIFNFFEERSAAFFALGLIKSQNLPVAVITTSGTAVAELLPATIEAYYQGLPLLLVTADRPKSYRRTGAPQAIEQNGLFSCYVENTLDWDVDTSSFSTAWSFSCPLHLNICFDEPLIDLPSQKLKIEKVLSKDFSAASGKASDSRFSNIKKEDLYQFKKPLVIVGQLEEDQILPVGKWLCEQKCPVYAESISQISGVKELKHLLVQSTDKLISAFFQKQKYDSVIRIGGVPTLRFWRDLEFEFKSVPVLNISNLSFSGLSRDSISVHISKLKTIKLSNQIFDGSDQKEQDLNDFKLKALSQYPNSEPNFVRVFSQSIGPAPIYLGNSLPIREWDQFAIKYPEQFFYANRGANGIDGQISSYLGWSEKYLESYCVIGDLTALYDLAALGLTRQLKSNKRCIVILNNFGGHIFKRVFNDDVFLNTHTTSFNHWAKMWDWDYLLIEDHQQIQQIKENRLQNLIVELRPDNLQSQKFWSTWDEECKKI